MWVPLIQKAFVKVHGYETGYETPGSTSSIDLWCLTGWIPESWNLRDWREMSVRQHGEMEAMWGDLSAGIREGYALFTAGPEGMDRGKSDRTGLDSGHAYAITDAVESEKGVRLLRVQDPRRSKVWKGLYSPSDAANWTPDLLA
eukprot:CAMPEP_0173454496 /NCGR_PEP_ID=MMETSP1357-20121228/52536_1 /TAXON_ID=77926 /ORGANISM="Hemiselmis rufescens, Strain PCC563" /LENGTH=143 /DNA_ID=CAMNT_0014421527 /DNA_START=45 /DNA_END=472 /DNA_ORIENTATION=+